MRTGLVRQVSPTGSRVQSCCTARHARRHNPQDNRNVKRVATIADQDHFRLGSDISCGSGVIGEDRLRKR